MSQRMRICYLLCLLETLAASTGPLAPAAGNDLLNIVVDQRLTLAPVGSFAGAPTNVPSPEIERASNNDLYVKAENLKTVNGSVSVGESATVSGEIGTVNGRITLERGTTVAEDVGNVNGDIEFEGAEVGGNVKTVSGNVDLTDGAVIKGDLVIEEPSGWSWGSKKSRTPEVVIGPGCRVEGAIVLEREVKLYISETAEVGDVTGKMSMSDAVRFSGKRP